MLSSLKQKAIKLAYPEDPSTQALTWLQISEQVGKTEQTMNNWKKDPEFKAALQLARAGYLQRCMETARQDIQSLAPAAVLCLEKAMRNGSVKAALAIAAGTGALIPPVQKTDETIHVEFGEIGGQ